MSDVPNAARVAVWRLKRMKADAVGVLEVGDGRVRFCTLHGIVEFDEPVADVTIAFPWYQLGASITVNGVDRRRYMFSPPRRHRGTMQVLEEYFLGPAAGVTSGISKKIAVARAAREALGSVLSPTTVRT